MPEDRPQKRYSAKLLFQFRVMVDDDPGKRRLCEERIVVLTARSAKEALRIAKAKGKKAQLDYLNSDENKVYFEFIGVMELLCTDYCEDDEVWYDIRERLLPSERKSTFIPPEGDLEAFRNE